MARTHKALKVMEHGRETAADVLGERIARLREEIGELAHGLQDYGGHRYEDLQHHASALVRDLSRQLPAATEELGRHARSAGRAVQRDPVPFLVAVGTVALLSRLFMRGNRR